jgi:hypothetical protein
MGLNELRKTEFFLFKLLDGILKLNSCYTSARGPQFGPNVQFLLLVIPNFFKNVSNFL